MIKKFKTYMPTLWLFNTLQKGIGTASAVEHVQCWQFRALASWNATDNINNKWNTAAKAPASQLHRLQIPDQKCRPNVQSFARA
jgi:hypothetical protein